MNGRISAMTGASREHNLIALNVAGELRNRFRGRPCGVYQSDMRVKVSPTNFYTYPDVVALCGTPEFEDASVDTRLTPVVLVAVLSPSTERDDRGEKFAHYRRLLSLREYVLVAPDRARAEHYAYRGEQWVLTVAYGLAATLALPALDGALPLAEVYERVAPFPDEPPTRDGPAPGP